MNPVIERLRKLSMETYTYSCDGVNNRGVRQNDVKFATMIIRECVRLNGDQPELVAAYEKHFGIKI